MIAIVDSGGANIASVRNALDRLGKAAELTCDPKRIEAASHVLFPGVGHAKDSMERLRLRNLTGCLKSLRQPVLGICLGMQLLFDRSEEGDTECLGLIPGGVARLSARREFPVPHMGWNSLVVHCPQSLLLKGITESDYFYFVHSYAGPAGDFVVASTDYGGSVTAVVEKGNYFGVQFHPEKSARAGARLLSNFLEL